jgi:hypothetical protein
VRTRESRSAHWPFLISQMSMLLLAGLTFDDKTIWMQSLARWPILQFARLSHMQTGERDGSCWVPSVAALRGESKQGRRNGARPRS